MSGSGARGVLVVTAASFVALTVGVFLTGVLPADNTVRDTLLALASPAVLSVMRVINHAGDWRLLLPGTLILFMVFARARTRWWLWIALMLAAPAAEGMLKVVVARPRPENLSMGFPSGHATAAAAFFGAVCYLASSLPPRTCRIVRAAAILMIVLVGIARVMLRAHWPSDVLAGTALGLALASAAAVLASVRLPAAGPALAGRT